VVVRWRSGSWGAGGEEGVGYDLGGLAPGDVIAGAEVGPVAWGYAGFAGATARVTADGTEGVEVFDIEVEDGGGRYVLEGFALHSTRAVVCPAYDLGELASCGVAVGAEVREVVGGYARLAGAAAGVAAYHATRGKSFHECVEGGGGRHILESSGRYRFLEARRVTHYFRDLSPGDVVVWAEVGVVGGGARLAGAAAGVAGDDTTAGETGYEWVESVALADVREV
jgi:hypothetical protein